MEQNKEISCDVCKDLMPLVLDEVASKDSCMLVKNHIENCSACNSLFQGIAISESNKLDDQRNISFIRKRLYLFELLILILGALFGAYITNTSNIFYNIILMPIVGGFGYFMLKSKCYLVPCAILAITYIWLLLGYIIEQGKISMELIMYPVFFSLIYTTLTILGIVIGILLKYAFQKEKKENE